MKNKILNRISKEIREYAKDYGLPNAIRLSPQMLNILRKERVFDTIGVTDTIFGMIVKVDHDLQENQFIIYRDKNIYTLITISIEDIK